MRDAGELVVVEIRYRRRVTFMTPIESITRKKRQRIGRSVLHFMQRNAQCRDYPVRFDVLGISGPLQESTMEWIPGAFTTEDLGIE
jgi:putative endonuclease